ncbi:MAG: hypothetical protein KAR16_06115 [Bacteroidales bacterium]|nr:hypothetical protein [Bacteroidales bacterium]
MSGGFTPFSFYSENEAILPSEDYKDYLRFIQDGGGHNVWTDELSLPIHALIDNRN